MLVLQCFPIISIFNCGFFIIFHIFLLHKTYLTTWDLTSWCILRVYCRSETMKQLAKWNRIVNTSLKTSKRCFLATRFSVVYRESWELQTVCNCQNHRVSLNNCPHMWGPSEQTLSHWKPSRLLLNALFEKTLQLSLLRFSFILLCLHHGFVGLKIFWWNDNNALPLPHPRHPPLRDVDKGSCGQKAQTVKPKSIVNVICCCVFAEMARL